MADSGVRTRRRGLRAVGAMLLVAAAGAGVLPAGGCAAGGETFRPAFVAENEAVIYVFRRGGPIGGPVDIIIDQEPVLSLGRGEYFAYAVGEGEHLIRVEGSSSAAARVTLRPGESVFVEVVTGALGGNPDLEVHEQEEGRLLIEGTREAAAR